MSQPAPPKASRPSPEPTEKEAHDMSMYELTEILWRRRRIVAAVAALLVVAGSFMVIVTRGSSRYTARSQVMLDQPQLLGTTDGIAIENKLAALLPTICTMLDGDDAVAAVAQRTGETAKSVRSLVQCTPRANTTVADLHVTTGQAARSQRVVTAAADVAVGAVARRYQDPAVPPAQHLQASILRAASLPDRDSTHTVRELALVFVGAVLLAAAFAIAAEPHRRDAAGPAWVEPSSNGNRPHNEPVGASSGPSIQL